MSRPRPEIPPILSTLIDAAFGRTRTGLQAGVIGREKRVGAVDRLNDIKDAILAGEGKIPYLAQLGLLPAHDSLKEMRTVLQLLEAIQALADWQISQPTGVDSHSVREFFHRVGMSSPWVAPAEIVFHEGNVSPSAQRIIRRLGRFRTSDFGGMMVQITPLVGPGSGAVISVLAAGKPNSIGVCPQQIRFDSNRKVWDVT